MERKVEAWVLPTPISMAELDVKDHTIAVENKDRLKEELELFMHGGDLWMRLWGRLEGVRVDDRAPQMTLLHLGKALRDLRCARNLIVGGYEAEAHLMIRRSDESLNLCELFLVQSDEAAAYAACETPEEFRKGFSAGMVRQKLDKAGGGELTQLRKNVHALMSTIGHESWKSIATFLTIREADGRLQRLLVSGQPHSETARITLGVTLTQMERGLRIMAAVLGSLVSADLKAEVEEFSRRAVHDYTEKLQSDFLAAQRAENS